MATVEAQVFALTFIAVAALVLGLVNISAVRSRRARRVLSRLGGPAEVQQSPGGMATDGSFTKRVLIPLANGVAERFGLSSDVKATEHIWKRLWRAGLYWLTPGQYVALRLAIVGILALVYVVYVASALLSSARPVWLGLPLVIATWWLPELWLRRRIARREESISASMSDAVDNLAVAMEAGLAFDSALSKVAKNMGGPLGEEFGRVLGELQIGSSRADSLSALAERTGSKELQRLTTTLVQADKYGIAAATALKTLATEFRKRRFADVEERAAKLPVKIVVPLVLLILPALLLVIMGPGVIGIMEAFS